MQLCLNAGRESWSFAAGVGVKLWLYYNHSRGTCTVTTRAGLWAWVTLLGTTTRQTLLRLCHGKGGRLDCMKLAVMAPA